MGQTLGLVQAGIQLGIEAILVKPKRGLGPFSAFVTLEEQHEDELMLTEQPVEIGARITDHSYKMPPKVTIKCGWSNSPASSNIVGSLLGAVTGTIAGVGNILSALPERIQPNMSTFGGNSKNQVKDIYSKLLVLQESRVPFDVFTGKRSYTNMLLKSLRVDTDRESENTLMVTATLQQVLLVRVTSIVNAKSTSAPASAMTVPQSTQPTKDSGVKALKDAPSANIKAIDPVLNP